MLKLDFFWRYYRDRQIESTNFDDKSLSANFFHKVKVLGTRNWIFLYLEILYKTFSLVKVKVSIESVKFLGYKQAKSVSGVKTLVKM